MATPIKNVKGRFIRPELAKDYHLRDIEIANPALPVLRTLICLWMYADKCGRFVWDERLAKVDILPHDDLSVFHDTLALLHTEQYLCRYNDAGELAEDGKYGHVRTWSKYQKPHGHESDSILPRCPCGLDDEAEPPAPKATVKKTSKPKEQREDDSGDLDEVEADPNCPKCKGRGNVLVGDGPLKATRVCSCVSK